LVAGLEFMRDRKAKESLVPSCGVAAYAGRRATEHGVITRGLGDMISLCPPMIINENEIDLMLKCIGDALEDTLLWARQQDFLE
jgi:4-aminobutyrate--pyruvate transaminase